jgi:hypothetical protein
MFHGFSRDEHSTEFESGASSISNCSEEWMPDEAAATDDAVFSFLIAEELEQSIQSQLQSY